MKESKSDYYEVWGCFLEPFERWHKLYYDGEVGAEMTMEQARELVEELAKSDAHWDALRIFRTTSRTYLFEHRGLT